MSSSDYEESASVSVESRDGEVARSEGEYASNSDFKPQVFDQGPRDLFHSRTGARSGEKRVRAESVVAKERVKQTATRASLVPAKPALAAKELLLSEKRRAQLLSSAGHTCGSAAS